MPDTGTSVSRRNVTPTGNSTSPRAVPIPPQTTEENIHEDVLTQTANSNLRVMPTSSYTSHRGPPVQPKAAQENIYEDAEKLTARKKLSSVAATAEEGEVYAVYDYTVPNQNVNHFK
jgi:hypothetical protein